MKRRRVALVSYSESRLRCTKSMQLLPLFDSLFSALRGLLYCLAVLWW